MHLQQGHLISKLHCLKYDELLCTVYQEYYGRRVRVDQMHYQIVYLVPMLQLLLLFYSQHEVSQLIDRIQN